MQQVLRNVRPINNFGEIIFPLPLEEKVLVRKLEKLYYKLNAAETAATFNKICLQEGLLPNNNNNNNDNNNNNNNNNNDNISVEDPLVDRSY